MKRSEMISKLVFSIELHAGSDPSWLEHDAKLKERAYDYAKKILDDLEEAGMSPPLLHPIHHHQLDMIQVLDSHYRKWTEE